MNLELNEQELNIVFNALAQRPFAEVFQLINKIQEQVKEKENV